MVKSYGIGINRVAYVISLDLIAKIVSLAQIVASTCKEINLIGCRFFLSFEGAHFLQSFGCTYSADFAKRSFSKCFHCGRGVT